MDQGPASRRLAPPAEGLEAPQTQTETSEQVLAAFAVEAGVRLSPAYVAEVQAIIRRVLLWRRKDHPFGLARDDIAAFIGQMREHGWPKELAAALKSPRGRSHAGRPVHPNTLRVYMVKIEAFFNWAVATERIKVSPVDGLEKPSTIEKAERAFTADEVRRLLAAARQDEESERPARPTPRWRLYLFLATTGSRIGEALALRWSHVDLEAEHPCVTFRGDATKKRRERKITLDEATADVLRAWRGKAEDRDSVFGKVNDRCLKRDMQDAGVAVKDRRGRGGAWHLFRRFTATELALSGADIKIAQQRLGHKNVTTTLRHYSRADESTAAQAVAAARLAENLHLDSANDSSVACNPPDDRVDSIQPDRSPSPVQFSLQNHAERKGGRRATRSGDLNRTAQPKAAADCRLPSWKIATAGSPPEATATALSLTIQVSGPQALAIADRVGALLAALVGAVPPGADR